MNSYLISLVACQGHVSYVCVCVCVCVYVCACMHACVQEMKTGLSLEGKEQV